MDTEVVPLFRLNNKSESEAYHAILDELLTTEHWSFGAKTLEFEQTFCNHFGHKYAIGVSNGTAAIQLVLSSLHAQQVWMADTTFIGVWNAAVNTKCVRQVLSIVPNIVDYWDVTTDAWMDALLPAKNNFRAQPTIAIVTHLYGSRSNVDIKKLTELGIYVIEDMSQCHGLSCSPDSYAQIYSMYPTKNVGALGEAGVITTDNPWFAKQLKSNSFYGYNDNKSKVCKEGSNYKMDELQAAFITHKLNSDFTSKELLFRHLTASLYNNNIVNTDEIRLVPFSKDATYHLYPMWVKDRTNFRQFMTKQGIQTGCHYDYSITNMTTNTLKNTSEWNDHVVTLPMGGWLKQHEVERVYNAINRYDYDKV